MRLTEKQMEEVIYNTGYGQALKDVAKQLRNRATHIVNANGEYSVYIHHETLEAWERGEK